MSNPKINLFEQSSTFPNDNLIENLIPVDSKLREINKKFDSGASIVIVSGNLGTGKTVLLSEFTKQNSDVVISYFISDNFWTLRQSNFLLSLCRQMDYLVHREHSNTGMSQYDNQLDIEQLKLVFERLYQKVNDIARRQNIAFYFVIDGLELASKGREGDRIQDLLPFPPHPKYIRFLGSISPMEIEKSNFKSFEILEPSSFSSLEIRHYFKQMDLNLNDNELEILQKISGGIPGYLYIIRKLLLENSISTNQLLNQPIEIENLLKLQWTSNNLDKNEALRKVLAILAFSLTPLNIQTISAILDTPESKIQEQLSNSGIISKDTFGNINFYPDAHKKIAQNLLASLKNESIDSLIRYYREKPSDKDAKQLLPEYYLLSKDLDALQEFLTPSSLVSTVDTNQGLGEIKRYLEIATDIAANHGEKEQVFKYSLLSSQIHSLSNAVVGESEVEALIAMEDYDNALSLADSAKLISLKIRLFSKIYREMERKGKTVSKSERLQLEQMVKNLNVKEYDPDEVLSIAAEIFPILPDCSISLVDSAELTKGNQTAMDVMIALASLNSEKTAKDDSAWAKIENTNLQEVVVTYSPWLRKLSAHDVIEKVKQISQTKAKVYLFREWCLQNNNDPNAYMVIDAVLDIIVSDGDYKVPLRDLRQISEPLRNCQTSLIENLCKRFDIPLFTSLHSPFEEKVRLELNLAESMAQYDQVMAWERFQKIHEEIFSMALLDADVSCYCLVRILISLDVLQPSNYQTLKATIKQKLEDEFIRLIDTAADQYTISRRILRALSFTDPDLSLTFADLLNVSRRRDKAINDVLVAYMRQDRLTIQPSFIDRGLAKVYDSVFRERIIYNLASTATRERKLPHLRDYWLEKAELIQDIILRCKIFAQLMSLFDEESSLIRDKIFTQLISDWEKVDTIWYRIEMAFDLVSIIAPVAKREAKILFDQAVDIRNQTPFANQVFGNLFFQILDMLPELVGYLDLNDSETKQTWDGYSIVIDALPSHALRIHLWARIAIARLLQGDKANFEYLIKNQILNKISLIPESEIKQKTIASTAYAIFEYSPDEAIKIIDTLSYFFKNVAWWNIAYRVLTKTNIGINVDDETPNISLDLARANKALQALSHVDIDERIYRIVNLFTHMIGLNIAELNESQKLDLLTKIEKLVGTKLPDPQNIDHPGYKLLALAALEKTKRAVAKKTKYLITSQHNQIIEGIKQIDNIADRVYVNSLVAAEFKEFENKLALKLAEEAFESVSQIPNIQDRIDRLETITKTYSKLRNTSKVSESIRLGVNFARTLASAQKDACLASIIQMAYQLDKNLASEITEKIEDFSTGYSVDTYKKSLDLSKSPQKLISNFEDFGKDDDVLKDAASQMTKALLSGKGTTYSEKTITSWLLASSHLGFDTGREVAYWALLEKIRSTPESGLPEFAHRYAKNLLLTCEILWQVGNQIAFLSTMPDTIKTNFQGLSSTQEIFKVGDRNRAISWISNWLRQRGNEYVKICDPYFDKEQLWVLQSISVDIAVKVVCAVRGQNIKKIANTPSERKQERQNIIEKFNLAWIESCAQAPPNTLIIIHDAINETEEKDEFHDRFIVTKGGGLSIGSSLNGLGKKECVIKILSADDASFIEDNYINPKLNIAEIFSRVMYFELGE